MVFEERAYTKDQFIKEWIAIENHGRDGSALDAGCECVEGKHYYAAEKYGEEGATFALSAKEKEFYDFSSDIARKLRKEAYDGTFNIPHNPTGRAYEPHGLTECEKSHPHVLRKISRCIKKVEKREGCTPPYESCPVNPVAVCRASVKCP